MATSICARGPRCRCRGCWKGSKPNLPPRDLPRRGASASGRKQTATLRQQMQSAMKGFFGPEICSTYVPADGLLLAKVTVDGASQPTMEQKVIWVSPTDGYKVSP